MTTYKEIFGKQVKNYSSDPANDAEGQVWYNSTSGTFKSVLSVGAWSAGGNLITQIYATSGAGASTQSAGLGFGGYSAIPNTRTNSTEEYNGSGWASGGNLINSPASGNGAGTQTAGLAFGGAVPPGTVNTNVTQEYDGSSWTAGGNLNTARRSLAGAGTQTAGLAFGGYIGAPDNTTEEYGGTSWTAGGNLVAANAGLEGTGLQTAAIAFGGSDPSISAVAQYYDGSSWTAVTSMNTARTNLGSAGTQTLALAFGGSNPSAIGNTETWNGTSWTEGSNLSTVRGSLGGLGTAPAALAFGGNNGATLNTATEEYNFSTTVTTGAAWSSGGNLNTGNRNGAAGAGIQTASIIAGGGYSSPLNNSESYDGSSWTNSPTMGTARGYLAGANAGPSTATVIFGGLTASSPAIVMTGVTEEYNGTAWSEENDLSTARRYHAGFGTQTAAVCAGGDTSPTPRTTAVEEYDGTNWTSGTTLPAGAQSWGSCGTQTTGLVIGDIPMFGYTYDGSTWTSIPTLNTLGNYTKVFGTQAAAIQAGRNNPPNPSAPTTVEGWDGTSWFSQASLATGRFNGALTGTSTSGLVAGGEASTATEEFTGETTALNYKTLTSS
jgi:hypothetical protein